MEINNKLDTAQNPIYVASIPTKRKKIDINYLFDDPNQVQANCFDICWSEIEFAYQH